MRLSRRSNLILSALVVAIALMSMDGCAAKHPIHPNQLNAADGVAYDTLLVAQSALHDSHVLLTSAQADFNAATFATPEAKERERQRLNVYSDAYNSAAKCYNIALADYALWRNTVTGLQKGDATKLADQLAIDLQNLTVAIAAFKKQGGGTL